MVERDELNLDRAASGLGDLAQQRAALRRIATLVARESSARQLFGVVAEQVARIIDVPLVRLARYEHESPAVEVVGGWGESVDALAIGTRWDLDSPGVLASVWQTGRPARLDDYTGLGGPSAAAVRQAGMRSAVASPINVEGRLWGAMSVYSPRQEPLPEDTEARLADFTELISSAIANAEARRELEQFAAEQHALRRTAMLVASGASQQEVFDAITASASELFDVPFASLLRYGADGTATMVAGCAACSGFVGQSWTVPGDDPGILRKVVTSRRPARIEDHSGVHGPLGEAATALGIGSVVGAPVIVNASVWGALAVGAARDGPPLPADAGDRLVGFTELVTTTLSNAEAREEVRSLLHEQETLRRVATLIAQGAIPDAVFTSVCDEAVELFDAEQAAVVRVEADESTLVVVGLSAVLAGMSAGMQRITIGMRSDFGEWPTTTAACRTGHAARRDVTAEATTGMGAIPDLIRAAGFLSTVATPIFVDDRVWGAMVVSDSRRILPADTERRMENFTELIATAIASREARDRVARSEARARELADEQAALRRVATLVAAGIQPAELFSAVSDEVARLFTADGAGVGRFEPDGSGVVVVGRSESLRSIPLGSRQALEESIMAGEVYRTGRAARVDVRKDDVDTRALSEMAQQVLAMGYFSIVGAPIVVEGELWGLLSASSSQASLPPKTERRVERFAELVATAVANAESRAQLAASRARLVSAGDETRRRLERDLHDGIQQWLVALALKARKAAGLAAAGESPVQELSALADDLVAVTDELREISRGIHPAILSDAGLDDALEALARRSAIPVDLDVAFDGRYEPTLEATVYYVVAESITNAIKHARVSTVAVRGGRRGDTIDLEIKDDGIGGAEPGRGTGLIGLKDRVETLGGTIALASPVGVGTTIRVQLPTSPPDAEHPPLREADKAASASASG